MPRTSPFTAGLSIVAAQVSINAGAALAKGLFHLVGPEGVAALRTGLSALVLIAIARPWRATILPAQWVWLGLYGLSLGGMSLLIYWAIARIPIGIAVSIEICGPLAVVLMTSRSLRDLLWFALAAGGLLLLVPWPGADVWLDPVGVVFAGGAAACWMIYILVGKRASQVEGKVAVAIGMTVACLVTVPLGIAKAGSDLLQTQVLAFGLLVAALSSALPFVLEMTALERLSGRVFGVVTSGAPAIAAMIGFVLLGERLSHVQWIAIAMTIAASAGCSLANRPGIAEAREDVVA